MISHAGLVEHLRLYYPTGAGFTAVAGEQEMIIASTFLWKRESINVTLNEA
jgi:hypothetical protein